jgi:hypothetical protein
MTSRIQWVEINNVVNSVLHWRPKDIRKLITNISLILQIVWFSILIVSVLISGMTDWLRYSAYFMGVYGTLYLLWFFLVPVWSYEEGNS